MDRFLIKLSVGYPDEDVETGILEGRSQRKKDSFTVKSRATPDKVDEMHASIEEVFVKKEVMRYIVDFSSINSKRSTCCRRFKSSWKSWSV